MNIKLCPIPPDTIYSLKEDLLKATEPLGLSHYIQSCSAWGDCVEASFPDTPAVRELLKSMKQICVVHIVL